MTCLFQVVPALPEAPKLWVEASNKTKFTGHGYAVKVHFNYVIYLL